MQTLRVRERHRTTKDWVCKWPKRTTDCQGAGGAPPAWRELAARNDENHDAAAGAESRLRDLVAYAICINQGARSLPPASPAPRSAAPSEWRAGRSALGLAAGLASGLAARLADREIFQLASALDIGAQPARRGAAARPGLGPVLRVAIFRRDLAALQLAAARFGTALGSDIAAEAFDRCKLCLQFTPRRRGFVRNKPNHIVAQRDKLIERHGFDFRDFHYFL